MFLKFFHILLAFEVFVSASGISIPKDFCMKTFVKNIIFAIKENPDKHENSHANKEFYTLPICKKIDNCPLKNLKVAKSEQDLKSFSSPDFKFKNVVFEGFMNPQKPNLTDIYTNLNTKIITLRHYRPPPLRRNIVVLFQNFRC